MKATKHPLYITWKSMKKHCYCKTDSRYNAYGGKGIKVCHRWWNFENFLEDMGERPEGARMKRFDKTKDFCPENCYWRRK